jgi:DNA polymerase-3 subunit gamma/tau
MSYQVIARKWRPQAFEEVTGQEHITQTLRNAIEHGRLHHAYLFSGARGVGKTTTARLLAKALNCHKTDKPNLQPCASTDPTACPSCTEITESRSIDVFEFDAASHTGIDAIRDIILDSVNVAPARDRYKIFIIDEVHMLSTSSFNALLKTVEEPPPNVVFIMATTELHKVPDTILSRCQQFEFRTIPLQKIYDRLKIIAEAEKVEISNDALREISRSGEGSMRDAQSNFDQVISFSGEKIAVADVSNALGMASTEMLTRVIQGIADKKPKAALDVVEELISRGQDLRNFCRDLLGLFRDLLVCKIAGETEGLVDSSIVGREELEYHAALFSESDFLRFFNSLAETESKLKDATQSRYVLEIGLVKLIEMRRLLPVEQILERLAKLEHSAGNITVPETADAVAAPATAEKKTLISEPDAAPIAVTQPDPPPEPEFKPAEEPIIEEEPPIEVSASPSIDLSFIDAMPMRLPPIDAEELEHVDDNWLDTAFEEKLARSGDDLGTIPYASQLAEAASGIAVERSVSASAGATAAAVMNNPAFAPPEIRSEAADGETPSLPENPTKENLFLYAQNHPRAKRAMRVLRAKIVGVKKL